MDAPCGSVLPGPNDERARSPWKRLNGRGMVASIIQLADNAMTMRALPRNEHKDAIDRGPGTPDVVLHYGRRPGSRARSTSTEAASSANVLPPPPPLVQPPADAGPSRLHHDAQLVMPSARRASAMILNDSSPPLSPVNNGRPRNDSGASHYSFFSANDAGRFAELKSEGRHHDVSWADWWGAMRPQPSPPSSLDSAAPSLTWSMSSRDEDTMAEHNEPGLRPKRSVDRILRPFATRERADIDPHEFSWSKLAPHAVKVILLACLFLVATLVLGVCLSTLPLRFPAHLTQLTLTEMRDMCQALRTYAASSHPATVHVFFVLTTFFVWKQAFCVPGSLITNIIYGAMYGAYAGAFFASIFTAVGGVLCYLMAAPFADVVVLFPKLSKPLHSMRVALQNVHTDGAPKKNQLWTYLLFLRLLPIVPYGMMNIACGVLGVPLVPFALTMAVGSVPWNFCTAQIGDLLQDVATAIQESVAHQAAQAGANVGASSAETSVLASSTLTILMERIWTWDMMIKLVLLSIASALPIVLQRYFGKRKHAEEDI